MIFLQKLVNKLVNYVALTRTKCENVHQLRLPVIEEIEAAIDNDSVNTSSYLVVLLGICSPLHVLENEDSKKIKPVYLTMINVL